MGTLDLRHHLGQFGHGAQDAVGHVVGVAGQEADALQPVHIIDHAQQIGQVGAIGYILAVAVHDLPQQHDFFHALGHQRTHLGGDVAHRPAALDAALCGMMQKVQAWEQP
jgi:hypothetical protein